MNPRASGKAAAAAAGALGTSFLAVFGGAVPVLSKFPKQESPARPPPIVVPKVEIPRLPSSFQAVFGGSVASTKLPSLEIAPPTKASVEEAPAAHESGSFDAVFPSKQPQAVSHVTVSDRQSFPAVFKPSQPPSTTKKPSSTPSGDFRTYMLPLRGSMRRAVEGGKDIQRRPLAWQYQAGNSENGFLPRVRVKTWGDAQMHWHGVNDDPDGEDILPYIKEPDRPAKLPHVDWATPKRVKDVQFLANKYCTKEEQEWFKEVLRFPELTRTVWKAQIRVLDKLPEDLWGVPADRQAAEDAAAMLTEVMHSVILRGWEHGCFRKMKRSEGEQQHRSGRGRGGRGRARGGARSRKRRRTDAEEPLKNEEISSSSESSDDEPLVPLQNQPHSAARVRVRRTFARVFACSDEEREAQGLREEGCRSDLSESSSEGWQPPNALGIRLTNTFCSGMIDWN
eukprot:g9854.t1